LVIAAQNKLIAINDRGRVKVARIIDIIVSTPGVYLASVPQQQHPESRRTSSIN